jgi:hypothetical protein
MDSHGGMILRWGKLLIRPPELSGNFIKCHLVTKQEKHGEDTNCAYEVSLFIPIELTCHKSYNIVPTALLRLCATDFHLKNPSLLDGTEPTTYLHRLMHYSEILNYIN